MAKRPRTARRGAEPLRLRAGYVGERGGRWAGPVVASERRGTRWMVASPSTSNHGAAASRGTDGATSQGPRLRV